MADERAPIIDTALVSLCGDGHIHIGFPGETPGAPMIERAFDPDDAYDFAQAILRCYDKAVGISEETA